MVQRDNPVEIEASLSLGRVGGVQARQNQPGRSSARHQRCWPQVAQVR
jgi:hypothetical protein